MTKKQISKIATRYNMYLAENGIEGVYEIRYTNSNSVATKASTLRELNENLISIVERLEVQKGWL